MCWSGLPMWGFWWIFPMIGLGVFAVMLFFVFRLFGDRLGHCGTRRYSEIDELRKEIRDLKYEIGRIRKQEEKEELNGK